MNNSINVSIIIPNYNCGEYLERCLQSIINQTYQEFEIIFVDNNSTDNSLDIVNGFIKKYPQKIKLFHQPQKGVSFSRNLGLDNASGKYISFIDADDYIAPTFLEKMIHNIEESQSDLCECGRIDILPQHTFKTVFTRKENIISLSNKSNLHIGTIMVWDKIFKKEIIDNHSIRFNNQINYSEDILFIFTYKLYCSSFSFNHECLYFYDKTRISSICNTNSNIMQIFETLNIMINLSHQLKIYHETINSIGNIAAGYYVRRCNSFASNNYPRKKEFIKKFLKFFKKNIPHWQYKVCSYKAQKKRYKMILNLYRCYYFSQLTYLTFILLKNTIKKISICF